MRGKKQKLALITLLLWGMFAGWSALNAQISPGDLNTLLTLKQQNDINNQLNWSTSIPVSNWQGVTVTNGRVTQLQLDGMNLAGPLVPLDSLSELTELILSNNQLTQITSLTGCSQLILLDCNFNGQLPLPDLSQNHRLKWLHWSDNSLTTVVPLAFCDSLENLSCAWNELTNISSLQSLNRLSVLYCKNNYLDFGDLLP